MNLICQTDEIGFRRTRRDDLDFVCGAEHDAENSRFVGQWTRQQHLAALASADILHLIVVNAANSKRVGYVILAGLKNANQSIEFRRIVVTEKNKGYGRAAVRLIKHLTFEKLNAHRLWLDVKGQNVRAKLLYESENFVTEGTLRECVKTETDFESLVVMSMLSKEFGHPALISEIK